MTRQLLFVTPVVLAVVATAAHQGPKNSAGPAFATSSIKPSVSGTSGPGTLRLQPGGGFSATNATLRELVQYAYQRHAYDRREVTDDAPNLLERGDQGG